MRSWGLFWFSESRLFVASKRHQTHKSSNIFCYCQHYTLTPVGQLYFPCRHVPLCYCKLYWPRDLLGTRVVCGTVQSDWKTLFIQYKTLRILCISTQIILVVFRSSTDLIVESYLLLHIANHLRTVNTTPAARLSNCLNVNLKPLKIF